MHRIALQGGQAMVMTLIFGVVVIVAALVLYRSGQLTSDKMSMQNASDAMAYSASVVEARDLNFASYMNRAVIANEVAIGQAVGLASWAFHYNSIGDWLLEYDRYLAGPTTGFSTSVLTPASQVFKIPGGTTFVPLLSSYAKGMSAINHVVNKAYGTASQIHHVATIAGVVGVLDEVRDDSAPDDSKISDFGLMSLLGHLYTYNAEFTRMYNPKNYVPVAEFQDDQTGETDAGGYGRLSAMVHNSGDPFTKGWHNPQYDPDDSLNGRGWTFRLFEQMANLGLLPFIPFSSPFVVPPFPGTLSGSLTADGDIRFDFHSGFSETIPFGIGDVDVGYQFDMSVWFGIGMERQGGSEIRMVVPLSGSHRNEAAGEMFSWSSADLTRAWMNFGAEFYAAAWASISILGASIGADGEAGATAAINGEREELTLTAFLRVRLNTPLGDVTVVDIPLDFCNTCPFPASIPIGTGFAQAAKAAPRGALTVAPKHMGTEKLGTGPIAPEAYGEAANTIIPWNYPPTGLVAGVYFQPQLMVPKSRNVGTSYGGLPRYMDTTDTESMFGSGGPFLLTGLQISQGDFTENLYDQHNDVSPGGQDGNRIDFRLDESFADNVMTTVSKSEVYFKRPLDIAQFARGDGYVEHGSAFNPYWQARLVETSHADRVAALLIDHKEVAQDGVSTIVLDKVDALWTWIDSMLPTDSDLIPR
ncbi:MAG: hypothetical protein ACU84Q_02760 [Gammaproteobacteria bacterium]